MAQPAAHQARPAPERRRLSGSERRASILDAAARVFASRGYDAARTEEIAAAAGVSKALIYEHFPGKLELYGEIVRTGTEEALSRVANAVTPEQEGIELLEAALGAFLDFVAQRPDIWRVITQDAADATMIALDESMRRKAVGLIAELVARDPAASQRFERDVLERVAEMINGATMAVVNWWLEHPSVSREQITSNLMDFLWIGLEGMREADQAVAPSALPRKISEQ